MLFDDREQLVKYLAAFYLVKTGLHPIGVIAVILAAEVALIDVVYGVEQCLGVRNGDIDALCDDTLQICYYAAVYPC